MRIKSYFTESVHEAMQKARFELGPEALLLSSKRNAQPDSASAYEVVFGVSSESRREAAAEASGAASGEGVARELAELRRQIANVQQSIAAQGRGPVSHRIQEVDGFEERLLAAGFSQAMAQELAQGARSRRSSGAAPAAANEAFEPDILWDELDSRFSVAPELGSAQTGRKVVLLVGPPGAGKTTTLVKLAIAYGIMRKAPLQILSTDTLRLGAAEQLHAYSKILGAAFQAVAGLQTLDHAFEELQSKKLILIDSPGFGPADMEDTLELSAFVQQHATVDVHLVLPATLQMPAMASALERFRVFRPTKLIFTHLDETEAPGCLLEAAIGSKLPISFLSDGQQIPENLREASKHDLRRKVGAGLRESVPAAA
jgi:flagellar biosynthesis protein FlhF